MAKHAFKPFIIELAFHVESCNNTLPLEDDFRSLLQRSSENSSAYSIVSYDRSKETGEPVVRREMLSGTSSISNTFITS